MNRWMLLAYRLPSKPSSSRVYIWRKLRKLGAELWNDVHWILPSTPRTKEQFQWVASEIIELGGEAQVWEAEAMYFGQEAELRARFEERACALYRALQEKLAEGCTDGSELSKLYQQAKQQDYFRSELGEELRKNILKGRGGE